MARTIEAKAASTPVVANVSLGSAQQNGVQGSSAVPRLSIVIPSIAFDTSVEHTLVSVLQHRPEYSEVIVVTSEHYDDPYELGREVRFLTDGESSTRIDLINHGCREARGDVVHLLLPGVLAVDGWTDRVLHHFADERVAAVAPVVVPSTAAARAVVLGVTYLPQGNRRVVSVGANEQRMDRRAILAPTLAAGFYRHDALAALGGFDREFGEQLADLELGLALRDMGLTTIVEPQSRVTIGQTASETPRTFEEALRAERLYRRHAVPSRAMGLGHAFLVATESLCGFPRARMITRLWGRMRARREVDPRPQYQARLERARTEIHRLRHEISTIHVDFGASSAGAEDRMARGSRGRRSAA